MPFNFPSPAGIPGSPDATWFPNFSPQQAAPFLQPSSASAAISTANTMFPQLPAYLPDFQQPFVPQDLWQMPMTFEWDWAGMSGYAGLEGGVGLAANGGLEMNGVLGHEGMNGDGREGEGRETM